MKKKLPTILLVLVLLIGIGVMAYPTASQQINKLHASQAVSTYDKAIEQISEADDSALWEEARAYNETITQNDFSYDVFSGSEKELRDTPYWNILNIEGNGLMGYVSVPKINEKIPIYHGTSDSVLQRAAGHLSGTRLPIGGEGNHSVLAAHRGLPSARLFTDLDQIEIGDKFYIHILDEVLAYQVDQISDMIDKDDTDTLTSLMQMEDGEDYVTLLTCTPYGINSHRLLVRGTRVPYEGEEEVAAEPPLETMVKSVQNYYMLYLMFFAGIILAIAIISKVILFFLRKKNKKPKEGE